MSFFLAVRFAFRLLSFLFFMLVPYFRLFISLLAFVLLYREYSFISLICLYSLDMTLSLSPSLFVCMYDCIRVYLCGEIRSLFPLDLYPVASSFFFSLLQLF